MRQMEAYGGLLANPAIMADRSWGQYKPGILSDYYFVFGRNEGVDEDFPENIFARLRLAQYRHQLLSTMALMGINRIVVASGRIGAKMTYPSGRTGQPIGLEERDGPWSGSPSVKVKCTVVCLSSAKSASRFIKDFNRRWSAAENSPPFFNVSDRGEDFPDPFGVAFRQNRDSASQ